jgi:dephospho-CoA kinase
VYRVGLTGNIASGKSAVARVWQRLGAHVVDADELARRAVVPGSAGLAAIRATFGGDVIAPDGSLDRARMRALVFADAAQRAALERIVHPEVARLRLEEEARLAAAGATVVVHVIPLLFEADLTGTVDEVVFVDAAAEARLDRLVRLRGIAPEEARRMIAAQMPATEKRRRADVLIENDGTLTELESRAEKAWRNVCERAGA